MKIGIFLSTTSEHPDKKKYLDGFGEGIQKINRDECFFSKSPDYQDCDIAVIFGFYGVQTGGIQENRKNIFTEHTRRKRKCIFIDADLFKHAGTKDKDNTHVRVSYESIFFPYAKHFNENSDNVRWDLLQKEKGIEVSRYRKRGNHILLCLNSNPRTGRGWSAGNLDIYQWAERMIGEIRKYTDREIRMRFHPNAKKDEQKKIPIQNFLDLDKNLTFSGGINLDHRRVIRDTNLKTDCHNAWACVVHTTSASTIPVLSGIPVFTENKRCPVYPVANHQLSKLESPDLIDRTQWLYNTAYCLWSDREMKEGLVWERFRPKIVLD